MAGRIWDMWEFDSGYAELAPYVTPTAMDVDFKLSVELEPGEARGKEEAALDHIRAERLFRLLQGKRIDYKREPWASREGVQQIRHPWWLFDQCVGNCLEITLAYAGMCLASGVGALLAITERHAFVVLTPGRLHEQGGRDATFEVDGFAAAHTGGGSLDPGVRQGTAAGLDDAVATELIVAVDAVRVTSPRSTFELATTTPERWADKIGPDGSVWLVDVPHLQTQDRFVELEQPLAARPEIRLFVPGGGSEFREFGSHRKVVTALRGKGGLHAIIGPSGRGKSTLARHLAEKLGNGAAWFLDASDRKALDNSLAMAQLGEEGNDQREVAAAERSALAQEARAQLRDAKGPWLVVLDNADGDPAAVLHDFPEPASNQLLLVTTTNTAWGALTECTAHTLEPVEAAELGRFGRDGLAELIDGRPLLLDALSRLAAVEAWSAADLKVPEADHDDELQGPEFYRSLLSSADAFGGVELRAAALAAFLPPNGQPLSVLERFVGPETEEIVERLVVRGLLAIDRNAETVRMHRLFGAVVRRQVESEAGDLFDEIVLAAAADPAARTALDEYGDLVTVSRLDQRLAGLDTRTQAPDEGLGRALHGIAAVLELHGHTHRSGATYERAERHLLERPELRADCLQGRARTVNQHHTRDRAMLEEAIEWAKTARQLLIDFEGEQAQANRCLAMQGLLMKPLAEFPVPGRTKMELLQDALDVLVEADDRRQGRTDVSEAEKARSQFNLAGIRIPMARGEPDRAEAHLDAAHHVYDEVGKKRRKLYRRASHPHIAACEHGLALVGYYRAILVPASWSQRSTWLREATIHGTEALRQRALLDGSTDLAEATKSATLLTKIALARNASPASPMTVASRLFDEAMGELASAGIMLESVPPLPPSSSGLLAAIERWARSDALRELIAEFDRQPPADADLPALLDWLEAFSVLFDYRKGERDRVDPPLLSSVTERLVRAAADALGLVEGSSLRRGRYDQVLILGGMARGCLSRTRQAAKLINTGELEAAAIVALGAFRDLGEREVELVEEIEGVTVANEYEAMDAGARYAFGLDSPRDECGQDSDLLGASWRVREYETDAGQSVSVVAAPSGAPGERRATTPDAFAWFATELAKLQPGQRLLIVTTDIYMPYQHADALRMLALPYGVEVDAVGVNPSKVHHRLAHRFAAHNYLQEIRSTIRSLRQLESALSART